MPIRPRQTGFDQPPPSEITPRALYQDRRTLLKLLGAGAAGSVLGGWAAPAHAATAASPLAPLSAARSSMAGAVTMEKPTPYEDATNYNNFYEFGTDKQDPARFAGRLKVDPWSVEIEGLVNKPGRIALDDLRKLSPLEERIYRLRCVEGWSMVIPWIGYSLSALIQHVQPQGSAKYVEFVTLADPQQMAGVRSSVLDWPYTEGLRMDEALHPLTLLTFGMYGHELPKQDGAPVRVVVPWKYGFKSAKSIVKIRFVEREPRTAWDKAAPNEYGFYSNVNPGVDHPRWSQATERRIGEGGLFAKRRKTLLFNGYEAQVGQLYAGMDLKKYF